VKRHFETKILLSKILLPLCRFSGHTSEVHLNIQLYKNMALATNLEQDFANVASPFEGIDPQHILDLIHKVPVAECISGKTFWSTYKKWDILGDLQKGKTVLFWQTNLSNETKNKILAEARSISSLDVQEESERQAMTTKHDKARLMHLRKDPGAAADWTAALREKTRAVLDSSDPTADPWNRLAEKFNDYEGFKYTNACIVPNVRSPTTGLYVPVAGMEQIATYCYDFNPTQTGRPIRDASWVRTQWRDIKGKIAICFNNYSSSGNQEEENQFDSWVPFAIGFNNDVLIYARSILNFEDMNNIGRALPKEVQRDTGAVDPDDTFDRRKAAAYARKRQRLEASNSTATTTTPTTSTNSTTPATSTPFTVKAPSSEIAIVLEAGIKQANELQRLRLLIDYTTGEERQAAIQELMNLNNNNNNNNNRIIIIIR
jgi:hypothetical protein